MRYIRSSMAMPGKPEHRRYGTFWTCQGGLIAVYGVEADVVIPQADAWKKRPTGMERLAGHRLRATMRALAIFTR